MAPEFPVPSIVDYRPKSTLVSPTHLVPKAKFPAIDFHGHPRRPARLRRRPGALVASLDALNVRLMVSADNMSGDRLRARSRRSTERPYKDRVRVLAGVNFSGVGPGWAEKADAAARSRRRRPERSASARSAKGLACAITKADGTLLKLDDPDLDPFWDACARLNLPVFIHTADPAGVLPADRLHNERWLELSLFADRRYPAERVSDASRS